MPYFIKNKCIYKKSDNSKVGCTKGSVKRYLAALYANVDESDENTKDLEEIRKMVRSMIKEGFYGNSI